MKQRLTLFVGLALGLSACMQPLVPWSVQALALSPDGGRVAVAWAGGSNGGGEAVAVIYDLTDLDPREIARHDGWKQVQSLSFSNDSERLVVAAQQGKQRDLFLWEPGTPPAAVTGDAVAEGDPALTPDGEGVVYRVKSGGAFRLAWRRLDGTGKRLVTEDSVWRYRPLVVTGAAGEMLILHQGQEGRRLHLAVVGLGPGAEPRTVFDGDGPEESPVIREGMVLFRRGPEWVLCEVGALDGSICSVVGPPAEVRWSGSLALGPGGAPAGIVDHGGPRGVARAIAGNWLQDLRDEEGSDATHLSTGGGVLAVVWQVPGQDAVVEIGPWAGQPLAMLEAPVRTETG